MTSTERPSFAERRRTEGLSFAERRGRDWLTPLESLGLTAKWWALTVGAAVSVGALLWWASGETRAFVYLVAVGEWRFFRIAAGLVIGFPPLFAGMDGRWEVVGVALGILTLTIGPEVAIALASAVADGLATVSETARRLTGS